MASFSYRAISRQGESLQGAIDAERIEVAARELKSQGLTLLSLEPGGLGVENVAGGASAVVSADQVLSLTRELAVLLRAGLPIDKALKVMIDMADKPAFKALQEELLAGVKGGKGLSQALRNHPETFSGFYVNMVRAGEASGHLEQVLERLSQYLSDSRAVRSSVVSAMIYPAILLVVAVLSIAAMLTFVVPQFETLFNDMGDALPSLTRSVLAVADALRSYGVFILLLLAALIVGLRYYLRTPEGRRFRDTRVLGLPILGEVFFKYEVAKFARTAGTLLANGVPMLQAITIATNTVDNREIKAHLEVLEPAVKRGQRMSVALEQSTAFSPLVVQMVRVGEESGNLDAMLTQLAEVYDGEVQAGIKRSLTILEPAMILVMGGIIALIIVAILTGIMSVNNLAI